MTCVPCHQGVMNLYRGREKEATANVNWWIHGDGIKGP